MERRFKSRRAEDLKAVDAEPSIGGFVRNEQYTRSSDASNGSRAGFLFSMARYPKPFLDLPDQVALLQMRGLRISDGAAAQRCLRRIGYYRLSAYWYPFRVPVAVAPPTRSDDFLPNSRFADALALYVFDKRLKLLVMDAIERVEIAMRVELSLCLGSKGAFSYLDAAQLDPKFSASTSGGSSLLDDWKAKMTTLHNQSHEEFVRHFDGVYSLPMPIWMACELWDFGMMSRLFSGLKAPDKQTIALRFGVPKAGWLESWLRALNVVRNIVAHHARLWNRLLGVSPALPPRGSMPGFDGLQLFPNVNRRVYAILCILAHLLSVINPNSHWKNRVVALANAFPSMPHAKLSDMGFPANWQTHSFWK